MEPASKLYRKRCQQTKERADALYRILNDHQREMERQGVADFLLRKTIKEEKAVADAEIEEYQQRHRPTLFRHLLDQVQPSGEIEPESSPLLSPLACFATLVY